MEKNHINKKIYVEKAPYKAKAAKRKSAYNKSMATYNKKQENNRNELERLDRERHNDFLGMLKGFVINQARNLSRRRNHPVVVVVDEEQETRSRTKEEEMTEQDGSTKIRVKFSFAVNQLGIDKVVPKKIHELMNVPNLTKEHIASHLQKGGKLKAATSKKADAKCVRSPTITTIASPFRHPLSISRPFSSTSEEIQTIETSVPFTSHKYR